MLSLSKIFCTIILPTTNNKAYKGAKKAPNFDINSRSNIKPLKTKIKHIITPKPINLSKINSL